MIGKKKLLKAIEESWCAETAAGEWDSNNPALNQCAVTALVVQDYWGGELLRCPMSDGGSHYWNKLRNGKEEDFTESQFEKLDSFPLREEKFERGRGYVLSFPSTFHRYTLLRNIVKSKLGE